MYKDKDKQKQAAREAKTRWKAKQGDKFAREALGIPVEGIPEQGIPPLDESIPPDLELCRYCSAPLPKLLKPRRWPGACYPCSLTNAGRVKTIDDLWPTYRYEQVKFGSDGYLEPVIAQDLEVMKAMI